MKKTYFLYLIFICILVSSFDLTKHSIPLDEIMSGGPPKDGIPSLTAPKFVSANEASFLNDKDEVMGLVIGGVAKAYPVKILSWHEAVNDSVGDKKYLVTW